MAIVYLNGKFLAASAAMVPADDAGLLRGEGLFETMRATRGRVFCVELHVSRLRRSARALGISLPAGFAALPETMNRLLVENGLVDARCRITLTAGGACLATAEPASPYAAELYDHGAAVSLSESRVDERSAVVGHKVTSYFGNMVELRRARSRGFLDALRLNGGGHLAEGCVSNVFLVRQGQLVTPWLRSGCLPGITRQVVLELARSHGLQCEERSVMPDELTLADEVFLTNTIMGVMPVNGVDGAMVGDGTPGVITRRMSKMYEGMVRRYCGGGSG